MGNTKKATFGGGCFWCMQPPFDELKGVKKTLAGYMGGDVEDPMYDEVCSGTTGHAEVVEVEYDPKVISYKELLEVFWRNIDPTTPNQQFHDIGTQYRSVIFYYDEEQRKLAQESKEALVKAKVFDAPIVTEITFASDFYPAEEYHQQYCRKNPQRYKMYKFASGREDFIKKIWG